MADLRLPLTDKNVANLPPAIEGQYRARDTDLAGFFVLMGVRSRTFMVQGDLRLNGERSSIRMKVGEVGDLTAREARAKAKELLGAIAAGNDPRVKRRAADMPKVGQVPVKRRAIGTPYRRPIGTPFPSSSGDARSSQPAQSIAAG